MGIRVAFPVLRSESDEAVNRILSKTDRNPLFGERFFRPFTHVRTTSANTPAHGMR